MWRYIRFFFQSILWTCVQQIQTICINWWFHYRLKHKASYPLMVSSVRWQGCTVHKPTSHGFLKKHNILCMLTKSLRLHGCMYKGLTRAIRMRTCTIILQTGAFTYGSMRQCWKVNYLLLRHIFILLCPYSWCGECSSYQWQLGDFSDLLHKVTALSLFIYCGFLLQPHMLGRMFAFRCQPVYNFYL